MAKRSMLLFLLNMLDTLLDALREYLKEEEAAEVKKSPSVGG